MVASLVVLALVAPSVAPPQAWRVDGIAAIVNGEIISVGEVERAMADADAVGLPGSDCRAAGESGDARRAAVLECLIDRALVYREVRRFAQLEIGAAEVDAAMAEVTARYEDAQALDAALVRAGRTREGLRTEVRRQLLIDAYVDVRFRSTILVAEAEARRLYEDELAPDMRARGIETPPYAAVADEFVVPILRERELNRRVQSWIDDLRRRAVITRRNP